MIENKAITYSLLAHVRNSGTLIKGPIDPFIPLLKRSLYKLNSKGILSGKSIQEIYEISNDLYSIDFPLPVLKLILAEIAKEVNTDGQCNFQIHKDGSFILKNFYFEDFEEKIQESKREIETLEKLYLDFYRINNIEVKEKTTIFDFIDKNKVSISKYLSNSSHSNGKDYTVEAQFIEFFRKIPHVFEIIRNIYLGSIISSYLEYKTDNLNENVELVFDTNFLISLLDLNTPEATHSCNKLIEVCKNLGYKFTILSDTIDETRGLIQKKAEYYSHSVLSKRVNPEDIYNACERRKLNRNDLERIVDNLETTFSSKGISILPHTEKYKNKAKHSFEYENFKKFRTSHYAALHDATVLYYVREKRGKKIKEFEKVNCWFVNNSITHDTEEQRDNIQNNEFQSETIRADELLNILWLANPSLTQSINSNELIDIGLSSIVAFTLNSSLPKASIIKELDENIQKYRGELITDKDILLISSRISHRQLKNINDLNALAQKNQAEFARRIKEEAQIQETDENERIQKFENLFQKFEKQVASLDKARQELKTKKSELENEIFTTSKITNDKDSEIEDLKIRLSEIQNQQKKDKQKQKQKDRDLYINNQVLEWRHRTIVELIIWSMGLVICILLLLWKSNWNINNSITLYKNLQANFLIGNLFLLLTFIFTGITFKKWYDKNHNHSNIENFKKGLVIPEYLNDSE
ncbi:coiled-coil domain-containing protein [Parasediminibacterium sp. JCM 36343]|uniref:coiled-coil domain-containing protein n=1 Tax=Parasediminibacterium sp. JCM 36343 TaxID=3374279 RepID=UPI0039783E0C